MRLLSALFLALPLLATAQTTWNVTVGGSTGSATPPFYNPQNLTIQVGDIVRWQNTNGTHNVNGSTTLYPTNPQGFTSGNPQSGGWVYEFTFTVPGVYNYRCTQPGHAATQFGQITVQTGTGIADAGEAAIATVYPVPALDRITVVFHAAHVERAEVIGLDGRSLAFMDTRGAERVELDVEHFAPGQYYVLLTDTQGRLYTRPFRKA
jgi:plastocyanin